MGTGNKGGSDIISIHALREEGDRCTTLTTTNAMYFNPRPPRGGRHKALGHRPQAQNISIHALREEGDSRASCSCGVLSVFQSTPSARRATWSMPCQTFTPTKFQSTPSARRATDPAYLLHEMQKIFQSTPSARRATVNGTAASTICDDFNPRPPRGGRLALIHGESFGF